MVLHTGAASVHHMLHRLFDVHDVLLGQAAVRHDGRLVLILVLVLVLVMVIGLVLVHHRLDVLNRREDGLHDRLAVVVRAALVRRGDRYVLDHRADVRVLGVDRMMLLLLVVDNMLRLLRLPVLVLVVTWVPAAGRSGSGNGHQGGEDHLQVRRNDVINV